MNEELNISIENGVGIICLNRPKAINALTPEMIVSIRDVLLQWRESPEVRLVLFEGTGERGFCAGGDVRGLRDVILNGDQEKAFEFFTLEYEMNRVIATYEKPIVALTHGVVMGGGIGVAGHAKYRITTQSSRFAMPEAAIGFFCDVGVRSLLSKVPRHRALMFMLTGSLVGAVDGVMLGLTDTVILDNGFAPMRKAIIAAGSSKDIDREMVALCGAYGISYGFTEFCNLADQFKHIFATDDAQKIYRDLDHEIQNDSDLREVAQIIRAHCPTSNWVHVLCLDAARQDSEIANVLKVDLRLAHLLAFRNDFVEGVRAVLVDKDRAPVWDPGSIDQVDVGVIQTALGQK